ncbi:MAG TPA: hypothetical protein VG944_01430 [Fimbriimonas sp.]|nr:hypothetical protein [Fimbriimonas sp.]
MRSTTIGSKILGAIASIAVIAVLGFALLRQQYIADLAQFADHCSAGRVSRTCADFLGARNRQIANKANPKIHLFL